MNIKFNIAIICLLVASSGCTKFLDKKPDSKLAVPEKAEDFQALLDKTGFMNGFINGMGEASADNYYLTEPLWSALTAEGDRNLYIWEKEVVFDVTQNPWQNLYLSVYISNMVLDGAAKFYDASNADWRNVLGSAYFYRANALHVVAATWAKAYEATDASTTPGIPLRLDPDFNKTSTRSTLKQTYDQIIGDIKESLLLLPDQPKQVTRPSRTSAYALLSRVYLSMRDYVNANYYADSSLRLNNQLLNYNTLNSVTTYPLPRFNREVLFSMTGSVLPTSNIRAMIDTNLYRSYGTNDLRKVFFFKTNTDGTQAFRGSYDGTTSNFYGIATDEIYLISAECKARAGDVSGAMNMLNALLVNRWKTGTFTPITATSRQDALAKVLTERRKELLMRDLRWLDIKRLNQEGAGISLTRQLGSRTYTLPPNDNRFALPIPQYVIDFTGMQQNAR